MSTRDAEYYLFPLDGNRVMAISAESEASGDDPPELFSEIGLSLGPLLSAALKHGQIQGARIFEISPESERLLANARTTEIGSYFRGVLRADNGKVTHQVQLREVVPANGLSPFEAIAAAQLAAIQLQLERIEDILNEVALNTTRVVEFIERVQRAGILEALDIVAEIHRRAGRNGALSGTDWGRLAGTIEFELKKQLRSVGDELDERISRARFTSDPKHSSKEMDRLDPRRVSELVELHRVLVGGLRKFTELLLMRKICEGSFDEQEALQAHERLQELYDRHSGVLRRLTEVAEAAGKAQPRSNLRRLFVDGIVRGNRNDLKNIAAMTAGRKTLESSGADSRRIRAISKVVKPLECATESTEAISNTA